MTWLDDRAVAVITGAAVGDALGGATEGWTPEQIEERHGGRVTRRVAPGGPARRTRASTRARVARLDLAGARRRYLARDPLPPTMDHLGLRFGLRGETARREGGLATSAAA